MNDPYERHVDVESCEEPSEETVVDLEAHMVRLGTIRKKKHSRKRPDRWPRKRRRF